MKKEKTIDALKKKYLKNEPLKDFDESIGVRGEKDNKFIKKIKDLKDTISQNEERKIKLEKNIKHLKLKNKDLQKQCDVNNEILEQLEVFFFKLSFLKIRRVSVIFFLETCNCFFFRPPDKSSPLNHPCS